MSFRLSVSSKQGTSVPRRDRERRREVSPCITYTLSPEELEKYRAMPKPGDKVPVGVNIDRRTEELRNQRRDEHVPSINLTREEYLQKRLSGMNRNQIAVEQGCKNSGALYYHLAQWGLKDPIVEERELEKLRSESEKVTDEFKNTTLADQLEGIKTQLEQGNGEASAEPTHDDEPHSRAFFNSLAEAKVAAANESETRLAEPPHNYEAARAPQAASKLAHKLLLERLHRTYVAKNTDYGDSFSQLYQEFGMVSVVIRLSDKLNRVKALAKQSANVTDETIRDTLLDLANYAVMAVMELDRSTI